MPNLSEEDLMQLIGIADGAKRKALVSDLLSEGLDGLRCMGEDDVRDACASYVKRSDGVFPIILSTIQKQRLKALVMWVKDQIRIGQPVSFEDNITKADLISKLDSAYQRWERRRDQKKAGESYLDSTFNTKLKSAAQWEKWNEELSTTLAQIIGTRGVPLTYVIRKEDTPKFDSQVTYEDAVIDATELSGPEFIQDSQLVHKVILKNISEDSDAYTYVKQLIKYRNGRRDILALKERYGSEAATQGILNKAKSDLANLRYKNEKSFSFEKFSSKLQKAYDELEQHGRGEHNGNIVDALWGRIQAPDIQQFVAALKVNYQQKPKNYKLILQDIAAEVASKVPSVSFAGDRNVSAAHTSSGSCPSTGAFTSDGSLFIGKYSPQQWNSPSVKSHWKEIRAARQQQGGNGQSQGKRRISQLSRAKNKIKKMKTQMDADKARIADSEATIASLTESKPSAAVPAKEAQNAGDSFGGKNSRKS